MLKITHCLQIWLPSIFQRKNRKKITEYLSRDSVHFNTDFGKPEKTSTMKDSYLRQPYVLEENLMDRYKIEHKVKRNKVVFGNDKNPYYHIRQSRANVQDFTDMSNELK